MLVLLYSLGYFWPKFLYCRHSHCLFMLGPPFAQKFLFPKTHVTSSITGENTPIISLWCQREGITVPIMCIGNVVFIHFEINILILLISCETKYLAIYQKFQSSNNIIKMSINSNICKNTVGSCVGYQRSIKRKVYGLSNVYLSVTLQA